MDALADVSALQGLTTGLTTAQVLILYKIHRDLQAMSATLRLHWHWIEKLRRFAWPEAFTTEDGREPTADP